MSEVETGLSCPGLGVKRPLRRPTMRKSEIKIGRLYKRGDSVLECKDLGEGRFPSIPKFRMIYPIPGRECLFQPREIDRQLSDREAEAFQPRRPR